MSLGEGVMTILHVAVALLLALPLQGAWAREPCSRDQEIAAESSASTLKNWAEVYSSFERFGHCDDGAIADGYSESISKILDTQWATVRSCQELRDHISFRRFVLRHINATVPAERLVRIASHARSECPGGLTEFCAHIARAARAK